MRATQPLSRVGSATGRLAAILAAVICLTATSPVYSGDKTVVRGVIGSVAGNEISVRGRNYNVQGVPVTDLSGKPKTLASVRPGMHADVCIRRGRISSVAVYEGSAR